jgi:hypothetical protein
MGIPTADLRFYKIKRRCADKLVGDFDLELL